MISLILLDWEWSYFSNCYFASPNDQADCAYKYYCLPQTLTWRFIGFVSDEHAIIAAAATAVIAWFTVVLVTATKQLGELSRQQVADARIGGRAYMAVAGVAIVEGEGRLTVTLYFKNAGQTPAYECYVFADTRVDEKAAELPAIKPPHIGKADKFVIGPEQPLPYTKHIPKTGSTNIQLLKDGKQYGFIWGEVRYKDIFWKSPKDTRFYKFKFRTGLDASGNWVLQPKGTQEAN